MKLLGLTFLLACSSAFASTAIYEIKTDLFLNGKYAYSPRFVVKEGQTASFTGKSNGYNDGKETFIDVIATKADVKDAVMMKFTVGTIDKNGKRTILASPKMVAKENQEAQISQGEKSGRELLALTVTAKKQIQ